MTTQQLLQKGYTVKEILDIFGGYSFKKKENKIMNINKEFKNSKATLNCMAKKLKIIDKLMDTIDVTNNKNKKYKKEAE